MNAKKTVSSLAVFLMFVNLGQAGVITVNPIDDARVADTSPQDGVGDFVANATTTPLTVGDAANNALSCASFVMELPTLNTGETFNDAEMMFTLAGIDGGSSMSNLQVDVFFKNTGAVEVSDYSAAATASLQDFMTSTSPSAAYTWTNADLVGALNTVYGGETTPSSAYAVFRLKWQGTSASDGNNTIDTYKIYSNEAPNELVRPKLTLTTAVPEPATLGLFSMTGGLIMVMRRMHFRY